MICNISDNSLIYKVHSRNKFGAPTTCEYGNDVATNYTYKSYGLLTHIQTGKKRKLIGGGHNPKGSIEDEGFTVDSAFLNYRYGYNNLGLMSYRSESVVNRLETYLYDNLDRLTTINSGPIGSMFMQTQLFSYSNNGNISCTEVGAYTYGNKPHAVSRIQLSNPGAVSLDQCDVEYNVFNQPTLITEGNYYVQLFYGSNQQRNKAEIYVEGLVWKGNFTRYYINKYYEEDRVSPTTLLRSCSYIYGDNGIVAMRINENSSDDMYYIHTDHLGSYCDVTDANKQVKTRNRFDPWGNHVVKDNTYYLFENHSITDRGFTGHEHYPDLKIINMNGRLYDPVIARFFSPDKYVANSSFTQDFNRYTYARNCPLMYTDPDGEIFWLIPVAYIVIQGAINIAVNWGAIKEASQQGGGTGFGKAMGFFGIGALNGAVSWYCPALAPVVNFGTSILEQGLRNGNFNDIRYDQLLVNAGISLATSMFSNTLVNSTLGKDVFFTKTLAGNMIKGAVSKNIAAIGTNLVMGGIYGDPQERWDSYKKTGWWQATLSGMNDGMKTHYQTNSQRAEDLNRKDYKDQMKNRDFRQNLSKTMKNDVWLSKYDHFELQMYRMNLPFTNLFNLRNQRPDPILQINVTVEPEIPTPTIYIPNNWEIWGP